MELRLKMLEILVAHLLDHLVTIEHRHPAASAAPGGQDFPLGEGVECHAVIFGERGRVDVIREESDWSSDV